MINIVTSICIDTDIEASLVKYPALGKNAVNKRYIYWQCVTTFCLTSLKFNPNESHIVFTNDHATVIIDGYDVKKELQKLGVQFIFLDFNKFDPKNRSKTFRNAFYKLEVIHYLSNLEEPSLLLDSDCIWTKRDEDLFETLAKGEAVLLQDTYQRGNTPYRNTPHNLSMSDMGELYNQIKIKNTAFTNPVWYGGELIGASAKNFKLIGDKLLEVFSYSIIEFDKGSPLKFNNGFNIFDNDEFVSSYVYNSLADIQILDTYGVYSKRISNSTTQNNITSSDINIAIWHLPLSKTSDLDLLFKNLTSNLSEWMNMSDSPNYFLGGYCGIPNRKYSFTGHLIRYTDITINTCKKLAKKIIKLTETK